VSRLEFDLYEMKNRISHLLREQEEKDVFTGKLKQRIGQLSKQLELVEQPVQREE
jgi:hypothetical protein